MASQFWQYCSSNFGAMFVLFVSAVLGSGANWLSLFRPVAIHNLHSLNGVFRPVPYGERSWSGTRFSFRANRNIVTKHGHDWCTITKNNWMCFGEHYERILNETLPYQKNVFQLAKLKFGTNIVADGNSYLAERLVPLICGSNGIDIYKLDGKNTNSIFAHSAANNATILLIDNDINYQAHNSLPAIEILRKMELNPTLLLIGFTNSFHKKLKSCDYKTKVHNYRSAFPHTAVIHFPSSPGIAGCSSDWSPSLRIGGQCSNNSKVAHQCLPGPISRVSENDARNIQKALRAGRQNI